MKASKLISLLFHPYTTLLSFCLILISGEAFGGFYLTYLSMALPHGSIHSLLALLALLLFLFSYHYYKRQYKSIWEPVLNFAGTACLYLSIVSFFYLDNTQYNLGTFAETIPLLSILLFGVLSTGFVVYNIIELTKLPGWKNSVGKG